MESIQDVAPGDVSDMPNENSYDNNQEMEDESKDDIGEDIEADQNKQFQCNQYFVLKEHLDTHENKDHCMGKEIMIRFTVRFATTHLQNYLI